MMLLNLQKKNRKLSYNHTGLLGIAWLVLAFVLEDPITVQKNYETYYLIKSGLIEYTIKHCCELLKKNTAVKPIIK